MQQHLLDPNALCSRFARRPRTEWQGGACGSMRSVSRGCACACSWSFVCAVRTALLYTAGGGGGGVLHYFSRGGPAVSVRATEMMCLYKSVYLLTPVLPCEMGALGAGSLARCIASCVTPHSTHTGHSSTITATPAGRLHGSCLTCHEEPRLPQVGCTGEP